MELTEIIRELNSEKYQPEALKYLEQLEKSLLERVEDLKEEGVKLREEYGKALALRDLEGIVDEMPRELGTISQEIDNVIKKVKDVRDQLDKVNRVKTMYEETNKLD